MWTHKRFAFFFHCQSDFSFSPVFNFFSILSFFYTNGIVRSWHINWDLLLPHSWGLIQSITEFFILDYPSYPGIFKTKKLLLVASSWPGQTTWLVTKLIQLFYWNTKMSWEGTHRSEHHLFCSQTGLLQPQHTWAIHQTRTGLKLSLHWNLTAYSEDPG